jgi:glycine dehydrogenase
MTTSNPSSSLSQRSSNGLTSSAASPGDYPPLDVMLAPSDTFARRHIGPSDAEIDRMLAKINADSLDDLITQTVPASIRFDRTLNTGLPRCEHELLAELKSIAQQNRVLRSLIGQGYHDTITPPVILRNILENPAWYTAYTPYQPEISQGRLEALLNYQTMIADLTGLEVANASLLDEGTAAAEAMTMARSLVSDESLNTFIVDQHCHPQTIAVVRTRAESMGLKLVIADANRADISNSFGILVQYPNTQGNIEDYESLAHRIHERGGLLVCAADILSLVLLKSPGEFGADIAVGSTQRFGVPMGFGGPHAAYMACRQSFVRRMPGRLIGVSKDAQGNPAYRLTLQTREQHIRRDKATSNICTAQVLLAVIAGMYAVYHGPDGLRRIARRVHTLTRILAEALKHVGFTVRHQHFFDTITIDTAQKTDQILAFAEASGFNLRKLNDDISVSLDELSTPAEVQRLISIFAQAAGRSNAPDVMHVAHDLRLESPVENRTSPILSHPIFNTFHAEHELLRYIHHLSSKDISLVHSMIALGSCTMKLNATAQMIPITWPEFGKLHPFAPLHQAKGYLRLFDDLENWLSEITGFDRTWLQPNAGSQGEYAGLLMIRAYHAKRGQAHRDICLIPESAHGTNPASAVIAGLRVVPVKCAENGDIDLDDLQARAKEHAHRLACVMITYPSTHGVFEEGIRQACDIIHAHGGQVYMDGANMNAQVGLCRPGDIGADVCHLNLHKTFCIPHGGGGPGMGPICMKQHLADAGLPDDSTRPAVSAAPFGSSSILPISWVYIALMGGIGLRRATQVAILSANYMASRLKDHFNLLFTGPGGRVAHEFVLDCRPFEKSTGIRVEDICKRLMDFGFHAPTMSWPVPGTLMIEPTESESMDELDRFCDAMIAIRQEIADIEAGRLDKLDNPLKHAPHTHAEVTRDDWTHAYPRSRAAYPLSWVKSRKFWPAVGRVDNAHGDRNLQCACLPMSEYR